MLALIGLGAIVLILTVRSETSVGRDPLLRPFPAEAIWNHPLGSRANLVPALMDPPNEKTLNLDEALIFADPAAPRQTIWRTNAGWSRDTTRCAAAKPQELAAEQLPIPPGFRTDPEYHGITPNHAAAIVRSDGTLFETQPLHICEDGRVVSQYVPEPGPGGSILFGGVSGEVGRGSHGGSSLSAFGGTIRVGEWVVGGEIPHAIKITLNARRYLWGGPGSSYRWPAHRADAYSSEYSGTQSELKMGSLLALPRNFDVSALNTESARVLATALRTYGAYIVDDAGFSTAAFVTEWGPAGRVSTEFEQEFGYELAGDVRSATGPQRSFLLDIEHIYRKLAVVDDNLPESIGGTGDPLTPLSDPLNDWNH